MKQQGAMMSQQLDATKRSIEQMQEMLTYANQQASAANTQASIAKESERPYIVVKEVSFSNVASGRQPAYVVLFGNSGKTTANNVSFRAIIRHSQAPLPEQPDYPLPNGTTSLLVLGVGDTASVTDTAPFKLNSSDLTALKEKTAWLYLYGFAEYQDSSGQKHRMQYCVYYNVDHEAASFCSQHNSSN